MIWERAFMLTDEVHCSVFIDFQQFLFGFAWGPQDVNFRFAILGADLEWSAG